jgi:hypothetical protein
MASQTASTVRLAEQVLELCEERSMGFRSGDYFVGSFPFSTSLCVLTTKEANGEDQANIGMHLSRGNHRRRRLSCQMLAEATDAWTGWLPCE